jgi:predicted metal-dependent hydrolase
MLQKREKHTIRDIELEIVYSARRTIAIGVLPDASVIVRVPLRTSFRTIERIVSQKSAWIIRHRDKYRERVQTRPGNEYTDGETHYFRGNEHILRIEKSGRQYVRFMDGTIELGLERINDSSALRKLLYTGYKDAANQVFPELFGKMLAQYKSQMFKPAGLKIRTMKRRLGSCSSKGVITLSTELIKLSDKFIEYVITHELCHLKHHNHGAGFYTLLSELYPDWKQVRKEMKRYIV